MRYCTRHASCLVDVFMFLPFYSRDRSLEFISTSTSSSLFGEETDHLTRKLREATARTESHKKLLNYSLNFPVYYINLATSVHRRRRIEDSFGPIWDLHRVAAVDGQNKTLCESLMGTENYKSISKLFPGANKTPVDHS